jgi:hypothetical protein
MHTLKPLSREGIPAALQKAMRYRLLNEPWEAESICRDVLAVEDGNQEALITLLLALTDQFGAESREVEQARTLIPRLEGAYRRAYYSGIICERRAKRLLELRAPGTDSVIYDGLRQAMAYYEEAERVRPPGEDDPLLRWNSCARILMKHPNFRPASASQVGEPPFE